MKKLLILPILLLFALFSRAQITSASDSLASFVSKDTLAIAPGYSSPIWRIASGPGVISNNSITGLKPGTTTVLLLQTTFNNTTDISYKVITVAPVPVVPPKPRSVVGFTFTYANGVFTPKYSFDDGTFQ